jgi:hypothetical protein
MTGVTGGIILDFQHFRREGRAELFPQRLSDPSHARPSNLETCLNLLILGSWLARFNTVPASSTSGSGRRARKMTRAMTSMR